MKLCTTAGYFIGALMAGGIMATTNVYLLGNFDPKFQDALAAALQVELLGNTLVALVGSGILFIALLFWRYQNRAFRNVLVASGFGASQPIMLYLVVVLLLASPHNESMALAIAGWLIIAGWPVLTAFVLKGSSDSENLL